MGTQQQTYKFHLNLDRVGVIQISKELSVFAQDYVHTILIPNKGQNGNMMCSLGTIEGEDGLLAVINRDNLLGDRGTIYEGPVYPVLRYDPEVYRFNEDLRPQTHGEQRVYPSMDGDGFLADLSYYLREDLKPDFTPKGIRKMLKDALSMQRFLQRVQ